MTNNLICGGTARKTYTTMDYNQSILDALTGETLEEKYNFLLSLKKKKSPPAKKITFEQSDIFNKHAFKSRFPDWSSDKLRHYHNAALTYSLEGNRYVNWDRAIHNWASADDARGKFKWLPDSPVTSQPLNGLVI